jgi:hypothetical protein
VEELVERLLVEKFIAALVLKPVRPHGAPLDRLGTGHVSDGVVHLMILFFAAHIAKSSVSHNNDPSPKAKSSPIEKSKTNEIRSREVLPETLVHSIFSSTASFHNDLLRLGNKY